MLSYAAERRAYLGEDPADIVESEHQTATVRAVVGSRFPGYDVEHLADRYAELETWAQAELFYWLYAWSERGVQFDDDNIILGVQRKE